MAVKRMIRPVTELHKCGNSVMTEEVFQITGENKIFDYDRQLIIHLEKNVKINIKCTKLPFWVKEKP